MYCTVDDISKDITEKVLIQLSSDITDSDSINVALVDEKIEEKSAYIDSYISSAYSLPITDSRSLQILKPICVSLVVCDLYQRRIGLDYSDSLAARQKQAVTDLERISKGIIILNESNETSVKPNSPKVSKRTHTFTSPDFTKRYL